ncbi:unnamed protein product, partial [Ectocarpus sp. 4 AP-2014]
MSHEILLGTDSWRHFPRPEYIDIGDDTCLLRLNNSTLSSGVSFSEDSSGSSICPKKVAAIDPPLSAAATNRADFSDMVAMVECPNHDGSEFRLVVDSSVRSPFVEGQREWVPIRVETSAG